MKRHACRAAHVTSAEGAWQSRARSCLRRLKTRKERGPRLPLDGALGRQCLACRWRLSLTVPKGPVLRLPAWKSDFRT